MRLMGKDSAWRWKSDMPPMSVSSEKLSFTITLLSAERKSL